MFKLLDKDGMSSDESETDDTTFETLHHAHIPAWRNELITRVADHVDRKRLEPGSSWATQGSKPSKRWRVAREDAQARGLFSKRGVKFGLPEALYDETWLNAQSSAVRLDGVSDEVFEWEDLVANL
jgi:hypothetical protein